LDRQSVIANTNVLPVGISPDGQRVQWRDVGECRFGRTSFQLSLEGWEAEHGPGAAYETELSFLEREETGIDALAPRALIFHASRCGSTLLANVLGASERIAVMSEPQLLGPLLRKLCDDKLDRPIDKPASLRVLRNAVCALGRRRNAVQRYTVLKFNSWNVLQAQALQAAFPGVPSLFLYREPMEIMVSLLRRPPGWLERRDSPIVTALAGPGLDTLLPVAYCARVLRGLMQAGLGLTDAYLLNYTDLGSARLPALLDTLAIEVPGEELSQMSAQFALDTKSFLADAAFSSDSEAKRLAAHGEIAEVAERVLSQSYTALEQSDQKLRRLP